MRYLRYGLAVLLFIAVLILLAVAALYAYVTPERAQAHVAAALEESFGIRLSSPEPASLKRLPKLVLSIENAALSSASGVPLGSVRQLVFTMNPFAIFAETPRLEAIALDGARLSLTPETAASLELAKRAATAGWQVDLIDLVNGELALRADGRSAALAAASARIEGLSEGGAVIRLAGTLSTSGLERLSGLSGEAAFAARADWSEGAEALRFTGITASLEGLWKEGAASFALSAPSAVRSADGWSISDALLESEIAGARLSASAPKSVWKAGEFSASAAAASLNGPAGAAQLSGSLRADPLSGAFSLDSLAIDGRLATSEGAPQNAAPAAKLTGSIRWNPAPEGEAASAAPAGVIRLAGTLFGAPAEFAADIAVNAAAARPQLAGRLQLGNADSRGLAALLGFLRRTGLIAVAEGGLDIQAAGFSDLPGLASLEAHASLEAGALRLSDVRAACLGGALSGSASIEADGAWRLDASLERAQASEFFARQSTPAAVSGGLSGRIAASGRLGEDRLSSLSGRLALERGAFSGLDVEKARLILMDERSPSLPPEVVKPAASTAFDSLSLELGLDGSGRPQIAAGRAAGRDWTAVFSGAVGAAKAAGVADAEKSGGTAEGEAGAPAASSPRTLRAAWLFELAPLGRIPAAPLSAALAVGEDLRPAWTLDWAAAVQAIDASAGSSGFSPSEIWKRLRRSLRDFWEGLDLELPSFSEPEFLKNWKAPWSSDEPADEGKPAAPAPLPEGAKPI